MPLVDAIRSEFESEAPITRRVLARVPLEKRDWQPHPKSMSLGRLASWLASAPGWVATVASADGFDVEKFTPFEPPATSDALIATFDRSVETARTALASIDDGAARGTWTFRMQGNPVRTLPRIEMLRLFLLSDAIHHRGQMSVFLRLLDVPVPSIYGPSADEIPG